MDNDTMIDIKPPYLSSAKMQKVLDLLSSRSFSQLSTADFTNRSFSTAEASQALQALRFLGFLDQDGKLLNTQFLLLKGEARQQGLEETIKKAYNKLFSRVPNPAMLSRDELYNEFVAEYGLSPRLTQAALPLFLWLSKEAGMDVAVDISPRQREKKNSTGDHPKQKKVDKHKHEEPINNLPNENQYHNYDISGIKLSVPRTAQTDILILNGELAKVTQEIVAFAKKAFIITEQTTEEKDSGGVA